MAILAAPQPPSGCFTNGTSIHTPDCCLPAHMAPKIHRTKISDLPINSLGSYYDDQDDHCNSKNDQSNVAGGQITGGEIMLSLVRAGGKLGKFLIIQIG